MAQLLARVCYKTSERALLPGRGEGRISVSQDVLRERRESNALEGPRAQVASLVQDPLEWHGKAGKAGKVLIAASAQQ